MRSVAGDGAAAGPPIVAAVTVWLSNLPPVPAPKPTRTFGGRGELRRGAGDDRAAVELPARRRGRGNDARTRDGDVLRPAAVVGGEQPAVRPAADGGRGEDDGLGARVAGVERRALRQRARRG